MVTIVPCNYIFYAIPMNDFFFYSRECLLENNTVYYSK